MQVLYDGKQKIKPGGTWVNSAFAYPFTITCSRKEGLAAKNIPHEGQSWGGKNVGTPQWGAGVPSFPRRHSGFRRKEQFFFSYHFIIIFLFSCVYYICVVAFLKEVLSWRVQACFKMMGEEVMKMWNNWNVWLKNWFPTRSPVEKEVPNG